MFAHAVICGAFSASFATTENISPRLGKSKADKE